MAKLKLYSNGMEKDHIVLSFETSDVVYIELFIKLVKNGGIASGLINPTISIKHGSEIVTVNAKNNWYFNSESLEEPLPI